MAIDTKRPVFLSSCFQDPRGTPLDFRPMVRDRTGGRGACDNRSVWMAEDFDDLRPSSPLGDMEKTELCLDGVRKASCVVVVLTERHGSQITTGPASFFEAEIFEAALLRKPTHIFILEGYEPGEKLANLLKILAPAFPNYHPRALNQTQIVERIERLVEFYQGPAWRRAMARAPNLFGLVDALRGLRHKPYEPGVAPPAIRFLGGEVDRTAPPPVEAEIVGLLDEAARIPEHHKRLTLIWIALRALMGAPLDTDAGRDLAPLWDRALGAWSQNGAWYGLHGHMPLGCLAAIASKAELHRSLRGGVIDGAAYPHGAFASEYYSIAKISGSKRPVFQLALSHADLFVDAAPAGSGGYAVRGSILMQLGRMDGALDDYERVTEIRQPDGGPDYGQALNEWGYALAKSGKRKPGIAMMERGVEILQTGPRDGFLVRAVRKLAVGYASCLKFEDALTQAAAAHDIATEIGAHDQVGQIERFAARWKRRR
jgi:tetratricopeptide (TPR) repeat protein